MSYKVSFECHVVVYYTCMHFPLVITVPSFVAVSVPQVCDECPSAVPPECESVPESPGKSSRVLPGSSAATVPVGEKMTGRVEEILLYHYHTIMTTAANWCKLVTKQADTRATMETPNQYTLNWGHLDKNKTHLVITTSKIRTPH